MHAFFKKNRLLASVLGMIVGTLIYSFSLVFILDFGRFYAGGITGISQIFANIFGIPYLKSLLTAVLNIPLFIIGWKGVSKRFAVLSLMSVVLQVIFMALFDLIKLHGFDPFREMAIYVQNEAGSKVLANIFVFAVLGGALTGLGCGITLRYGASSGGMDIVSQRVALHSNISFVFISAAIDIAVIIAGMIVAEVKPGDFSPIETGVNTIIRLFIHIIVLDKVYTIYKYQRISIITKQKDEMKAALLSHFSHGLTIYKAVGGYTDEEKWLINVIILTYELEDYRAIIHKIDPHAFVTNMSITSVDGNYNKKVIS